MQKGINILTLLVGLIGLVVGTTNYFSKSTNTKTIVINNHTEIDSLGRVIKKYIDTNKTLVVEVTKSKETQKQLNFIRFKTRKQSDSIKTLNNLKTIEKRLYIDSIKNIKSERNLIIQDTLKIYKDSINKILDYKLPKYQKIGVVEY